MQSRWDAIALPRWLNAAHWHTTSNPDTLLYVNRKLRQTRVESQQQTRLRLIRAATKAFIRDGFESSSVERICEKAGYSRGAFYSNFKDKEELFLEVLRSKRKEIDDELFRVVEEKKDARERLQAILDWYVNLDLSRDWVILECEFRLHAFRHRAARTRAAEFTHQGVSSYTNLLHRHIEEGSVQTATRADIVATSLLGAARGLAELQLLESDPERKKLYAECRDLVFQRLVTIAD